MIGHVVAGGGCQSQGPSLLELQARSLARALDFYGLRVQVRAAYLHPQLDGVDWDALDEMAVHTHGRPGHQPPRDCVRFEVDPADVAQLRVLLPGLMDPRVRRPRRHRTWWQRLIDRRTGRVTMRRVDAVTLQDGDVDVRPWFQAAFVAAVEQGLAAPDTVTTPGRLQRSQLVQVTIPAATVARVIHWLQTRPVMGGAR